MRIKLNNSQGAVMSELEMEQYLALDRLVAIAKRDNGQSRRVANLLLSWYNAKSYGGFDLTDLWSIDEEIVADIGRVLQLISRNPMRYPDVLELDAEFSAIIALHRPNSA